MANYCEYVPKVGDKVRFSGGCSDVFVVYIVGSNTMDVVNFNTGLKKFVSDYRTSGVYKVTGSLHVDPVPPVANEVRF